MRIVRLAGLCLLLASLLTLLPSGLILAQDEEEKIELVPAYSKLEATYPGASFEFDVELPYQGSKGREFDLSASVPQGWSVSITPSFGTQNIRSIRLEPNQEYPDSVTVTTGPSIYTIPEPREYEITLEAVSGDLQASVALTAVITATYSLDLTSATELLNTTATVGKENFYSIVVRNTGSGTIENIKFSSSKPTNWAVEFYPEDIDELLPGQYQTIEVNIKPAPKAIAGDYEVILIADAKQTGENLDIRVTVQTPTIWGWVGIVIILVVIAGVTFIFLRFSRR
jgi:uncharacterized repeat protein (TIGR01451 family)